MSRDNSGTRGQTRSSALWGTGNRGGDSRANALWGKGGRGFAAFMLVLVATAVPLAGAGKGSKEPQPLFEPTTSIAYLEAKAATEPNSLVNVIIQSAEGVDEAEDAFKDAGKVESKAGESDEAQVSSSSARSR